MLTRARLSGPEGGRGVTACERPHADEPWTLVSTYSVAVDITLSQTWHIGEALQGDHGGFGSIREARDKSGNEVVAKFVPNERGAQRELLFGDSIKAGAYRNVVPVLDHGAWEDQLVLIMPLADKSLRARMKEQPEGLEIPEVLKILADVATALVDIEGHIVHRDLKPENILLLGGRWCLTDFGIAKYADSTTSAQTRKYSMTRPYAAPEQWRYETATSATDVYAFGVMAYELVEGIRPFDGPDYRQQHLHATPEPMTRGTVKLRTLVEECLYKSPEARPKAANILARIEAAGSAPSSGGLSRLAAVNSREVAKQAREQAEAVQQDTEKARRHDLFQTAKHAFEVIPETFLEVILDQAPTAKVERNVSGAMEFVASLGEAKLGISHANEAGSWSGPFEVAAAATIVVNVSRDSSGWQGRAHSLWFCDAQEKGRFAWYETAFMSSPLSGASSAVEPFSLTPAEASVAFSGVTGTTQVAWPVEEIDRSDLSDIVDRWIGWFADAASGLLRRPSLMPERSAQGSWRRR